MTAKHLLDQIERGLDGVTEGPWRLDYMGGSIGCENAKIGGFAKLFDIRGWGYLTGTGHGGLGLSPEQAKAIQDANAAHVIRCSPDAIREIAAYVESLLQEIERLKSIQTRDE